MPDQVPLSSPASAPPPVSDKGASDQKPSSLAIRTMSSDIDALLKTGTPSISQIITKDAATPAVSQRQIPSTTPPMPPRNKGPIIIIIGIILIAGLIGGGVWYLLPTTPTSPTPTVPSGQGVDTPPGAGTPQTPPVPLLGPPPAALFNTDASRTITIPDNDRSVFLKLVTDTLQEPERTGTVKRILIKLQPTRTDGKGQPEHYASITEFFDLWHIAPSQSFFQHLEPSFTFFVYYGQDGPRIGFAAKTRDQNRTLSDIFFWEQSLVNDLAPFFFQEQIRQPDPPLFEDRTFSNTDWRYIKLSSQKDIGVGYMIFQADHLVLFTTSKGSMESIIKTLYGT
ncbi:MAG: hypothetical protein HY617_00330 [Candidatus Sungbacteria bacterium]|nr:hypothetical protein [Candidatus Sungbacteria bacterium]